MTNEKSTLSKKLLTRVLSVYFILTVIVTAGQIVTEYVNAKSHIAGELQTLKNTFSTSLTRAMWELNMAQAKSIAVGLMELPIVEGVQIRDENGQYIADLGRTSEQPNSPIIKGVVQDHVGGTFGYSFPLIFEFSGRTSLVGDVALYSSAQIIFSRIEVGIFFLIGNAIIKTAFLVFLFMSAFRTMLTNPLNELRQQISDFDIDDLESSKLHLNVPDKNEFTLLEQAYNGLIDGMADFQKRLNGAQAELQDANRLLDDHNISLEQEVAKKTATLSKIMLDLEQQKDELIVNQRELRQENENRQFIEDELRKRNNELASSMDTLQLAKDQLVESERMASLGGLVAGIAHDVNTPLGVGVTATSFLQERLNTLEKAYQEKTLTGSTMNTFLSDAQQTITLLTNNLNRASNLISSFKQVAVDQASEAEREINLKEYLNEIIQSLAPSLKKTQHVINISCPDSVVIVCAPGMLAQIFTNMVMNSIIHGFEDMSKGTIDIKVTQQPETLTIDYSDNGKGLPQDSLAKHFDAFYTTRRGKGGSGLGTHIMYNLVTQTLKGDIEVFSEPGKGLQYVLTIPLHSQR
ncbi:MAG: ATP-binding protein [Alteromonadaceae bacterium]|uniref:histidine kinase n=1 Tax=Paraglaciecola chathamensis TaxID=368405 RepID=A0A8H9IH71_9ALTE|nr:MULTISPECIES: HAMP domain-containing sensor histidine kinase [Paraglaciecola]AEE24290.1 integral membrane sensor signal transduction histidine kinase [Glaciecola sp. 4H-3-7+YE-5]MBN24156.1 ATP-binding protein [Alteromonadaceae bacterium]MBJ2135112.1 ATP-binding protein [Paraglaciecola chathamensis]MDO6559163.1 ATP-binding protein [Paraglaciecola chathamensis]MDO6838751.1 ATP-binding protein [Paraglaciecola chathamensis]